MEGSIGKGHQFAPKKTQCFDRWAPDRKVRPIAIFDNKQTAQIKGRGSHMAKGKKTGGGSRKGKPNRLTTTVKGAIEYAADEVGGAERLAEWI